MLNRFWVAHAFASHALRKRRRWKKATATTTSHICIVDSKCLFSLFLFFRCMYNCNWARVSVSSYIPSTWIGFCEKKKIHILAETKQMLRRSEKIHNGDDISLSKTANLVTISFLLLNNGHIYNVIPWYCNNRANNFICNWICKQNPFIHALLLCWNQFNSLLHTLLWSHGPVYIYFVNFVELIVNESSQMFTFPEAFMFQVDDVSMRAIQANVLFLSLSFCSSINKFRFNIHRNAFTEAVLPLTHSVWLKRSSGSNWIFVRL